MLDVERRVVSISTSRFAPALNMTQASFCSLLQEIYGLLS
jgi:hypothetical protein